MPIMPKDATAEDSQPAVLAAERAFLRKLEAGCLVPVGGYAALDGGRLHFRGIIASPDGVTLPEGKVDTLEIPALAISSTDVRRRAEHDEPVWYLVPDGVVQYIGKHGLYSKQH